MAVYHEIFFFVKISLCHKKIAYFDQQKNDLYIIAV